MKTGSFNRLFFTILITLCVVVILICTVFIGIRLYVNQYIKDNYNRRVAAWQETAGNIPDNCIVFIGDSHTEYFTLDEYFTGFPVINRGIYGDTTYGVIKRLDKCVFNLKPSKIFLLIGANDINKTSDTNEVIAENIREIIKQINRAVPDTRIYLQSLYPVNRNGKNSRRVDIYKLNNKRISEINLLLETFCNNEDIDYIDMFSQLTDEQGQLCEEFTVEGLHLNAAGYRFVTEILRPYIE